MSYEAERKLSQKKYGIPLLIDPTLMRSLGGGQIDLAWHLGREIELWEVKSTPRLGRAQRERYKKSMEVLIEIFELPCRLKLAVCRKDSLIFTEANSILLR